MKNAINLQIRGGVRLTLASTEFGTTKTKNNKEAR